MKKLLLITALTAALVAQPTQCVSWKNLAIGTVVTTVGLYIIGSYLGWFNKTGPKTTVDANNTDDQKNLLKNGINTTIIQNGINDNNTINLNGNKISSDMQQETKEGKIKRFAENLEKYITQTEKKSINPLENTIEQLKKEDITIICGVLNYKFNNKQNLLEKSNNLGALPGANTAITLLRDFANNKTKQSDNKK